MISTYFLLNNVVCQNVDTGHQSGRHGFKPGQKRDLF